MKIKLNISCLKWRKALQHVNKFGIFVTPEMRASPMLSTEAQGTTQYIKFSTLNISN
jgi:hypothetical protein